MIKFLHLENVRGLNSMEVPFSDGVTVISGKNGAGKTTLLEAIHLLSQGYSFRSRELREMIAWEKPEMILRGNLENTFGESRRAVSVQRNGEILAKKNGTESKSGGIFFGETPAVAMQPSDIGLVQGAPEQRRRWMNELLCFQNTANADKLRRYRRVLMQRNSWLKQKKSGEAPGGESLYQILTEQLIELGAFIWQKRLELTQELSRHIAQTYELLSNRTDSVNCTYRSSAGESGSFTSPQEFKNAFAARLETLDEAERRQGITLAGPHKDDFVLWHDHHELRTSGSQGQCRSAAIAMRFSATAIAETHLAKPVLLLDDIFAELDPYRRAAVAELIRQKQTQVFIATPRAEDLSFTPDQEIRI
ncbi:MAG: DNA replication and repair protein RecF [Fibrobacter sp.]|jgi:DNA replication and repair protein RecF|nr:DNA replication and repair protein RecF [Fibrobacter sp.]